jgi:hypothetical protein
MPGLDLSRVRSYGLWPVCYDGRKAGVWKAFEKMPLPASASWKGRDAGGLFCPLFFCFARYMLVRCMGATNFCPHLPTTHVACGFDAMEGTSINYGCSMSSPSILLSLPLVFLTLSVLKYKELRHSKFILNYMVFEVN